MTDLKDYASLSEKAAALALDDDIRLSPDSFASDLDERLPLGGLVLHGPGRRFMSNADLPNLPFEILHMALSHDWYAERETYRRVGLWLLHILFSGRSYAGLSLTHPKSCLKSLWVYLEREEGARSAFLHADRQITYRHYDHFRLPVVRHPFADGASNERYRVTEPNRPAFNFGWSDPAKRYEGNADTADEMILSLTPEGLCAMASLLMDFAAPTNDVVEVNIETPFVGFAATQPLSAEARFWLPGSFGFYADTLDDMSFPPVSGQQG